MKSLFSINYKLLTLKWSEFRNFKVNFITSSVLGGFCRPINNKLVKKIKGQIEKNLLLPVPITVISNHIVDGIQRFAAIKQVYDEAVKKNKLNLIAAIENMDFPVLEIHSDVDILEVVKILNSSERVKSDYGNSYGIKVALELNTRIDSPFRFKIKFDKNGPGEITIGKLRGLKIYKKMVEKAKKAKMHDVILAQKLIDSGYTDLQEAIKHVVIN